MDGEGGGRGRGRAGEEERKGEGRNFVGRRNIIKPDRALFFHLSGLHYFILSPVFLVPRRTARRTARDSVRASCYRVLLGSARFADERSTEYGKYGMSRNGSRFYPSSPRGGNAGRDDISRGNGFFSRAYPASDERRLCIASPAARV